MATGIILIYPDKQALQLSNSLLVPFTLTLFGMDLFLALQKMLFCHHLPEICLMAENVGRYHLNMLQDKTFQRSFPDIVPAAPLQLTAFAMAAAVEESVFNLVVIVRIEHHSCSAVRTIDQPGKHAASPGSGLPVTMTPDL